MGLAAVPGREKDFLEGLKQAIKYAKAVSCKSIHIMVGRVPDESAATRARHRGTLIENLNSAYKLLKKGLQLFTL